MGYVTMTSACYVCSRVFNYNPMRVPSVRVKGQREPICAAVVVGGAGHGSSPRVVIGTGMVMLNGFTGAKPEGFCFWVIDLLGFTTGDLHHHRQRLPLVLV